MHLTSKILTAIEAKEGNRNHLWIYDRSGSMHYLLKSLGDDMVRLSKLLKKDDTLTLSWFSGEGSFRTILKGFLITKDNDFSKIEQIVRANISSLGTTCFSEVLHDTVTTIQELKVTFPENTFVLSFFTDGYPVVSNYKKEIESITKALSSLQADIGEALFIGYGDYYNRELLSEMTELVGGTLVHSETLDDYDKSMTILIKSGRASRKISVDFDEDVILVFGKSSGQIVVYPMRGKKAMVADSESEIFAVTKKKPKVSKENLESMYAAAYALASKGQIDEALEWLGRIGDKYLIDRLYNAFTTSEIGEVTNEIHNATFDESKRFLDGQKSNYVPKADAFCLLEAIDELIADKNAYFYPSHKDWDYKRIGAEKKTKDGYEKFNRDAEIKCAFDNLTMSNDRLNLSILTRINGYIMLPNDCKSLSLEKHLDCYQWRNYTLVKDGILNVRKLPCSMSKETFQSLRAGGLIAKKKTWKENEIYTLDLKRIPIINRVIADGNDSARVLANLVMKDNHLAAEMKILKYFHNELTPDAIKATVFSDQFSDDQMKYLLGHGVRADGSYSPPTEGEESNDYYIATTFELKPAGWSSLPKVSDVLSKPKLNAPGQVMKTFYDEHKPQTELKDVASVSKIERKIEEVKNEQKKIRSKIQRAKFAVVLGKRWFKEFNNVRENCTISADDGTFVNFVLGKKNINY